VETGSQAAADRRRARLRVFACVCAVLAAVQLIAVVYVERATEKDFARRLSDWAEERRGAFDLIHDETLLAVAVAAELAARDPQAHALLSQGRAALAHEGGGAGGALAAAYRDDLRERLRPFFRVAADTLDARLMQAMTAPGPVSFTRVHRPDLYGDSLAELRPLAAEVMATGERRLGFEIGRTAAALRAIVPVFAAPGAPVGAPIGAVEIATGFRSVLDALVGGGDLESAVVLRAPRPEEMNAGAFDYAESVFIGGSRCVIDSQTGPGVGDVLSSVALDWRPTAAPANALVPVEGAGDAAWRHVAAWPLRTRSATADAPYGWALVWRDATGLLATHRSEIVANRVIAAAAFALLVGVVGAGQAYGARRTERAIESATAEIAASREAAIAADAAKSRFLAAMSHEIRTPLNGVLGMAELLERTRLDPAQQDIVATIRRSGRFLLDVINDVLDLSRIEAGGVALERARYSIAELVRDVADLHRAAAAEEGLSLDAEILGDRPWREGDAHRLRQILHNLVGNALKFTETGGVAIRVDAGDPERLALSVIDTGPGMDPAVAATVFRPFAQADETVARRTGGAGLGLAIVHGLVETMGGTITLDTAPGRGVAVRIALPAPAVAAPDEARENAHSAPDCAGLRCLAADDNLVNRMVLDGLCESLGVAVEIVEDGAAAVAAYKADPARDVLLLDVMMPGMDGPAALAAIRAWEAETGRAPVPAIACTAHALSEQAADLLARGFDAHLPKPISAETLACALAGQSRRAAA
jgi:signal transduction histidine kinase